MSLEKLLIFGFGLAVFTAIAMFSGDTADIREDQNTGYMKEVDKIVDMAQ